jgi:hypothetical protein
MNMIFAASQPLSDLGPDEYEPFEDLGNPTFDPSWRIADGVLELQNYAPSARATDQMFVALRQHYGHCTGLRDISPEAFCATLQRMTYYYRANRDRYFRHGMRAYVNDWIAGRQSVRSYHLRCIGQGRAGGYLGPYRTLNDQAVVSISQFPTDFTVKPFADEWKIVPYPTPHAGVDLLLVPPAELWEGGLVALGENITQMRKLHAAIRRVMTFNALHFAWGSRFLIMVKEQGGQSPIPGMPFECRLLAGGIMPGNPVPVPCYDDLGRYSMVPGMPDEAKRTRLVELLDARAKELGKVVVPSYWGAELAKIKMTWAMAA